MNRLPRPVRLAACLLAALAAACAAPGAAPGEGAFAAAGFYAD